MHHRQEEDDAIPNNEYEPVVADKKYHKVVSRMIKILLPEKSSLVFLRVRV